MGDLDFFDVDVNELITPNITAQKDKDEILKPLNDSQKKAVVDYHGLSFVSAGPGSGKTRVLVSRAAYMIADGIPAYSILLFTFTKKAANEIKERVESLIGDKAIGMTISTYHSFCARLLRRYGTYVGLKKNFTIMDDEDKHSIISEILKELDLNAGDSKIYMNIISQYKERYISSKQAIMALTAESGFIQKNSAMVYEKYQKILLKNNAVDFDDLIFDMVKILEENAVVRDQVRATYRYIIADESQDSSKVDVRFIFNLTNQEKRNLCFIGDSDQAIYGFRGAQFKNLFDILSKFEHKTFKLEQNYRSTKNIVEAANSLIQYNKRPDNKTIFTENQQGQSVYFLQPKSQFEESEKIASWALKLKEQGCPLNDMVVLYRNTYLSREIEDSLIRNCIPYEIVNGTSFYERREVKDIVSFLSFLSNPLNFIALERIINIPKSGLGEKSFEILRSELSTAIASCGIITVNQELTLLREIQEKNKRLKRALKPFVDRLSLIVPFLENKPSQIIDKIIEVTSYKEYLKTFIKDNDEEDYDSRIANIDELKNMALGYNTIGDFLDNVMLTPDIDAENGKKNDSIKLMTMHASKGLEFPVVFIVDAIKDIIPSIKCRDEEEERRLFYVAMTRAKELLVITAPKMMKCRNRIQYCKPSIFLSQIDTRFIKKLK